METAAAILTQMIFENETKAHNLNTTEGGFAGTPEDVANKIRPLFIVLEETMLLRTQIVV